MFGNQFYPTPDALVDRMIEPLLTIHKYGSNEYKRIKFKGVLEPSAGKGNILDKLTGKPYDYDRRQVACIELDPELRMILHEKGYRVIDSDFLEYNDNEYFDLIMLNPPFAQGVKHLLKAWEILASGGSLCCILNAATIREAHTRGQELLLRLISDHGRYEFHQQEFQDAEHKTDVEIAIVWLKKPEGISSVEFEGEFDREVLPQNIEHEENALASRDQLEALVNMYNAARLALEDQHKARARYLFYTKGVRNGLGNDNPNSLRNDIDQLKKMFWDHVFEKTKIGLKTTSEFKKKFDGFAKSTGTVAFTLNNIISTRDLFVVNMGSILEQCIVNVFDAATAFHEDNKVWTEGWKTNKSWRCARKIILPYGPHWEASKYGGGSWRNEGAYRDFFNDLDKVMCFITGRNIEHVSTVYETIRKHLDYLEKNQTADHRTKIESSFFEIQVFKKGTVHIFFRDRFIWDEFNQKATLGKRWVGDGS